MPHIKDITHIEIDPNALDSITESLARELTVLPLAIHGDTLRVALPADTEAARILEKLRFILNRPITFDTADRRQIEAKIGQLYPTPSSLADSCDPTDLPAAIPAFDRDAEFEFLDLIGQLSHSSASSVSFQLGRKTDSIELPTGNLQFMGEGRVFSVCGWLDAHYPCHGFHKLLVRCSLPNDYVRFESMRNLIRCVTAALGLPPNVSYQIHIESSINAMTMEHPQEDFVT